MTGFYEFQGQIWPQESGWIQMWLHYLGLSENLVVINVSWCLFWSHCFRLNISARTRRWGHGCWIGKTERPRQNKNIPLMKACCFYFLCLHRSIFITTVNETTRMNDVSLWGLSLLHTVSRAVHCSLIILCFTCNIHFWVNT